ncbi:hypothetical protein [Brevibacterium sp. RIT 803]|uniref:hypothetical protein n=1 Tax=Brevibacterium sp. RIT 803 TaxID=2810210 RepID=UPI00194FF9B6|nr:hypothetical protein [Brevibacterium sp. RIT 803]MBM6588765.1 hypothetical protein [Brevibacterium sp. RIT 803]
MDIPSFLATYGGPGGLAIAAVWWAISDRKFSAERRAELREDIDREQNDNKELRAELADERAKVAALEAENRLLRLRGGDDR